MTNRRSIDYGPVGPGLTQHLESLRANLSPEKMLVMAKLLGRTVAIDGDSDQQRIGRLIDRAITAYFRKKYPESQDA